MKKIIIMMCLSFFAICGFAKELSFDGNLGKVKFESKFIDDESFIWGASPIKGEDGKYHLFYSQWPRKDYHNGWVVTCYIAHAVSDNPTGPWKFVDIALKPRDPAKYWDGSCTHNPTIKKFGDKYYLYYMGNVGDGKVMKALNWNHRNNQRIGVAVSDSVYGPWKRSDKPVLDVSKDIDASDSICVTNPAVSQMKDGRFLLLYKAVGAKRPAPNYGPVVHLTAISDRPDGGFVKTMKETFTLEGSSFPAEDPFIWYHKAHDCYYAVVKDCNGGFVEGYKNQPLLLLFTSKDGVDWKLTKKPFVIDTTITWENGEKEKLYRLERPQLLFDDDGNPIALFVACDIDDKREFSFNLSIPINVKE